MKKKVLFFVLVLSFAVILILNFSFVKVNNRDTAIARYVYADKNITAEISTEDMKDIAEILDGKRLSIFDLPSCGFDENVAVVIGNKTFCIACDDCATIFYKDKVIKGYINLETDENKKIRTILESYGFVWPCV